MTERVGPGGAGPVRPGESVSGPGEGKEVEELGAKHLTLPTKSGIGHPMTGGVSSEQISAILRAFVLPKGG